MNNEPVAWFEQDPNMKSVWYQADQDSPNAIPLYTHPADLTDDLLVNFKPVWQEKPELTLTDEEMKDLIQEYWGDVHIVDPEGYLHEIAFIKTILRKAQEK